MTRPDDLRRHLIEVLGAAAAEELTGGHQARVFRITSGTGERTIAKVLDARAFDEGTVGSLVGVVAQLAEIDPQVCRPMPHAGRLVTRLAVEPPGLMTCYEFADGVALDPMISDDAAEMGRALARLHRAMATLPTADFPLVAALRGKAEDEGAYQLLHGDFSAGNLRRQDGLIRIFDFDDCGRGPVAFEVANALYMVMFDAITGQRPETYPAFARAFAAAYNQSADVAVSDEVVQGYIHHRVAALGRWLDDLPSAPIGIRNASPEWHAVLRAFVRDVGKR